MSQGKAKVPRRIMTPQIISRCTDLRKAGFSWNECADMMGEKMQSLRAALDRNGVPSFGSRGSAGGHTKTPPETVLRARELRAQGVCWKLVERELGVSFNTLAIIICRENKAARDGQ